MDQITKPFNIMFDVWEQLYIKSPLLFFLLMGLGLYYSYNMVRTDKGILEILSLGFYKPKEK